MGQIEAEQADARFKVLRETVGAKVEDLRRRERETLEGHLESEIASAIQRLLQDAEAQRIRINDELARRPTSTGVRHRLLWPPLSEQEGAPLGLEAARKRLLNASADLLPGRCAKQARYRLTWTTSTPH